jgi:AcrR family transcriptional regulator
MTSGGMRARIQEVALEMFAERGYDQTSLREIADRLNVTKAALYYHFKTKDEILSSALDDYLSEVRKLIEWARQEPATAQTRDVILLRYAGLIGRRVTAMRFMQQDQKGVQHSEIGKHFQDAMSEVNGLLTPESGGLLERMRALSAIVTLHVGVLFLGEREGVDPEDARAVALQVSQELVAANHS